MRALRTIGCAVGALVMMLAGGTAQALEPDMTAPTVSIPTPMDGLSVLQGNFVPANYECHDEAGGSGVASCVGTVPVGDPIDTSRPGTFTFSVTATDNAGNVHVETSQFEVTPNGSMPAWGFGGFLRPVDNLPVVNVTKAGSVVPVKFSLGGDQGLDIFVDGAPKSVQSSCDTGAENDLLEATASPGATVLTYDAASGVYHYNWQTAKSWKGTCRMFVMSLADGTTHRASFKFS